VDPQDFGVAIEERGDVLVVRLAGELDVVGCARARDAVGRAGGWRERAVLDLSRLTFVDTSGLHFLLDATRRTRAALVRGPRRVQELFEMAGLDDRLPFMDDLDGALRHVDTAP